jgi:hypothetical protein
MVKLRKECMKTKEFAFAYRCAPHAIDNLYMDLIKELPWSEARFQADSIHGQNLEIVASSSTII